jgi:pimeloyl-ACP methyl ester carboxylesterase
MGGPIACLMARDHADAVSALVLCATAREWQDPRMKAIWSGMGVLRLVLGAFPHQSWRWGLRRAGFPDSPITSWVAAELSRGSARDLAEAGRELGRFDSRTWIRELRVPAAVVVTTRDSAVPPRKQYELAESLGAPVFEIACDHSGVTVKGKEFCRVLLDALGSVSEQAGAAAA